jgi:hypothetical protein
MSGCCDWKSEIKKKQIQLLKPLQMNIKRVKPMALCALIMLFSFALKAQNLIVNLTDSSSETFAVPDILSIKFGSASMILYQTNGTITSWDISDIVDYVFEDDIGTPDQSKIHSDQLIVYPNPSSGMVTIVYETKSSGVITVDILDDSGRFIQSIYRGEHSHQQTYQWNGGGVSAGVYFCRIITETKTVSKQIIIQ